MEKKGLLTLARSAIDSAFSNTPIDKQSFLFENPSLAHNGAAFVTLTKNGNLRGCIGSLVAHRPLIEDVIHNAKSAAFGDPRFAPLTHEELAEIHIEVSILSAPKELPYDNIEDLKQKIKPMEHGVILALGERRATFLPQVWEQLPSFEQFFFHLCNKAGLQGECLHAHPLIYTYTVEKIKE